MHKNSERFVDDLSQLVFDDDHLTILLISSFRKDAAIPLRNGLIGPWHLMECHNGTYVLSGRGSLPACILNAHDVHVRSRKFIGSIRAKMWSRMKVKLMRCLRPCAVAGILPSTKSSNVNDAHSIRSYLCSCIGYQQLQRYRFTLPSCAWSNQHTEHRSRP